MSYNAHNTHTVPGATARAPTMGEKIEGTVERTMGHMLPFTDLGHQLKADGARLKGDEAKAEKAESHMDHGVHQSVSTSSYVEGELERAAGHALPFTQAGHRLKAEGALHKGDVQTAEKAGSHLAHKGNTTRY